MKTIFLDFDGVLFDTTKEGYLLARYAYSDISPFDEIEQNEYELFCKYRYLIVNSWQYYHLMSALNTPNVEQSFKNSTSNRDEKDKEFDIKFQEKRKDLIQNHNDFWQSLDTPYPFFYEIKALLDELNVIIISTKNSSAIYEKLNMYGLKLPFEKIIGKEILKPYLSKGDFLKEYISKNSIKKALFIEDSKINLDSCSDIAQIEPILVDWGYSDPSYQGQNYKDVIQNIVRL